MRYMYKVRDKQGQLLQGTMVVDDRQTAVLRLRNQGYFVTSIKEQRTSDLTLFQPRGKIKAKTLALLCRQFSIQLEAGVSLLASLELLADEATDKRLQQALEEVRLEVASGSSFSQAIEKHKNLFPVVFLVLVEAGETAGVLPEVMSRLAIYYEREDELQKKIKDALTYPTIIFGASSLIVAVLLFFILPMLVANFANFGVEPPVATQMILNFRELLMQYWYVVIAVLISLFMGGRWFCKSNKGRYFIDSLTLKIPLIGNLLKMIIFSRFCRSLALLLNSGITMINSLEMLTRLLNNLVLTDALDEARKEVERGQSLTTPLRRYKLFPKMLIQIVSIGEETGNLENTLVQLSNYYDREINFAVSSLTKMIEPIVMMILAIVVLFILLSVYVPMMQMITQI